MGRVEPDGLDHTTFEYEAVPRHRLVPGSTDAPVMLESGGEYDELLIVEMKDTNDEPQRVILNAAEVQRFNIEARKWLGSGRKARR